MRRRKRSSFLRQRSGFSRTQKRQLDNLLTDAVQKGEQDEEGRAIIDFKELGKKADEVLGTNPNAVANMMNRIIKEMGIEDDSPNRPLEKEKSEESTDENL